MVLLDTVCSHAIANGREKVVLGTIVFKVLTLVVEVAQADFVPQEDAKMALCSDEASPLV